MITMTSIRESLKTIGAAISLDAIRSTQQLFKPHVRFPAKGECLVHKDVPYGEHSRHRLDIFSDGEIKTSKPVVIFVHGGGFVAGDKGAELDDYYANIGLWCVSQGYVGVVFNYRLAPTAVWPAVNEDIDAMLTWLHSHIGRYGGDANRLVMWGQSAGAAHLVSWISGWQQVCPQLRGLILCSGLYDITAIEPQPTEREIAYFGEDQGTYKEKMNVEKFVSLQLNSLFTVSEFDPPLFKKQAKSLIDAYWHQDNDIPNIKYLTSHNHFSTVYAIGNGDFLEDELKRFLKISFEG